MTATTVGAMATVHPRARVAIAPTLARRASHRATPTTNVPRPCACSSSAYMPAKTMVGASTIAGVSTIDPPVALTDVMIDVMSAGPMAQATTAATSEAMIAVGGVHRVVIVRDVSAHPSGALTAVLLRVFATHAITRPRPCAANMHRQRSPLHKRTTKVLKQTLRKRAAFA